MNQVKLLDNKLSSFPFRGYKSVVILFASPSSILNRRLKDTDDRPDRKHNINFLIQKQKMEIDIVVSQAVEFGIPFCFIHNEGGKNPTTTETLLCLERAV